jgi:hypothetical protein
VRAQAGGNEGPEVAPGEALLAEDDLPGADQVVITLQQGLDHFPLAQAGVGQAPEDGHALGGGDQVQAEPQKNLEWLAQ